MSNKVRSSAPHHRPWTSAEDRGVGGRRKEKTLEDSYERSEAGERGGAGGGGHKAN